MYGINEIQQQNQKVQYRRRYEFTITRSHLTTPSTVKKIRAYDVSERDIEFRSTLKMLSALLDAHVRQPSVAFSPCYLSRYCSIYRSFTCRKVRVFFFQFYSLFFVSFFRVNVRIVWICVENNKFSFIYIFAAIKKIIFLKNLMDMSTSKILPFRKQHRKSKCLNDTLFSCRSIIGSDQSSQHIAIAYNWFRITTLCSL